MKYTQDSQIENLIDVVHFFEHLLYEKELSYHPDDDFSDYVNTMDDSPSFTDGEVRLYNRLMDQCFDICEKEKMDIYSIGLASMRRIIKPDVDDPIEVGLLARIKEDDEQIFKIEHEMNGEYMLTSLETGTSSFVDKSKILLI